MEYYEALALTRRLFRSVRAVDRMPGVHGAAVLVYFGLVCEANHLVVVRLQLQRTVHFDHELANTKMARLALQTPFFMVRAHSNLRNLVSQCDSVDLGIFVRRSSAKGGCSGHDGSGSCSMYFLISLRVT